MADRPAAEWDDLTKRLDRATGTDPALDAALAAAFGQATAPFTGSADAARALAAAALPGWRLHVGFDVSGVFPYARLSSNGTRAEAGAGSLPLAIVRALVLAARTLPPSASPVQSAPPVA